MRQDFAKLDKEWNKFKATEASVCLEKELNALEEHSKKLKKF